MSQRTGLALWRRQSTAITPDRARRMRWFATGLLAAMAVVFLTARQFLGLHPAVGYIVAFAEAAMVGGMADWFAVTALFRHPLRAADPAHRDHPGKQGSHRRFDG